MADTSLPLEHVSVAPEAPTSPSPAVILLHGRGADEQDLLGIAHELPDELHGLSVRAPTQLGPGYTWYDLDLSGGGLHASQPDPDDFDASLELVEDFVTGAIEAYDIDSQSIGLLGFSQGAILSLGLLARQPQAYSWVVGLHGYLPQRYEPADLERAADVPVFLGAGTQDQVIPSTRAEDAADRLEAAGVDVTFNTYPIGHGIAPQEFGDVREFLDRVLEPL